MWTQLRALIALRLLLLRRIWLRNAAGAFASILVAIFALVLVGLALGAGAGLFYAAWRNLAQQDPRLLVAVTDVLILTALLAWALGLVTEIQRADAIDFRRMLYLPVSLRMVFLLNFTVSLASPLLLFFGLGSLGFIVGLALGAGPRMLWGLPLAVAFYLMLAAWTYHIRGLLAILMENKRRRRLILTLIPLVFIVVVQLPNILVHMSRPALHGSDPQQSESDSGDARARIDTLSRRFLVANAVIPAGWLPLGIGALRQAHYGTAALCFLGMTGLAGAGLAVGYRSTRRHYTGTVGRKARKQAAAPRQAQETAARIPITGRTLPFVADDTAALAHASAASLLRHPNVRIQLLMPFVFALIFLLPVALGARGDGPTPTFAIGFFVYMVMANAAVLLANAFGTDPEGFQTLVLLPTDRRRYLLAKNIALLPPVAVQILLFTVVGIFMFRPGLWTVAILLLQFLQVYLSLCIAGNLLSIHFPFRVRRDAMRGRRGRPAGIMAMLMSFFGLPLLMVPTVLAFAADRLAGRWLPPLYAPLGLALSVVFLAFTVAAYRLSLPPLGRLLQAKEQAILLTLRSDRD